MVNIRTVRLSFLVILLITLMAAEVVWQYRPTAWSPERQVSNSPGDSRIVDVLPDPSGGVLHLVWEDGRDGTNQVFYEHSLDDGVTWEADVKLSNLSPGKVDPLPRLAANGKVLLVFFSGQTEAGENLFYTLSTDSGSDFATQRQLTTDPGYQSNPAAAIVGTMVHLVWQNYVEGEEHVYYTRSLDAGATWQSEVSLTNVSGQDRHPAIVAIGEKVFVVWSRFDEGREAVFFRASYDSGGIWDPEVQLSDYQPPIFLTFPSVASNGTHVHVVWNGGQLLYARSADRGSTWDPPLPITDRSRQYLAPKISAIGSQLQVVTAAIWPATKAHPTISSDVYYLQSPNGGDDWSEPISLTDHAQDKLSLAPSMSVRADDTFIAWQDNRNGHFAVFVKSRPDFAELQAFERQLVVPVLAILAAAAAIYVPLELKSRKGMHAVRRPKPFRRKSVRFRSKKK